MVEGFFSKMIRQMLRGIRVKSKEELTDRINRYFAEINEEPIVFHWKSNLDDIDVSEEIIVDTLPVIQMLLFGWIFLCIMMIPSSSTGISNS